MGGIYPQIPRRTVLTEAPRSTVSPSVIATPWKVLAGIFGEVGDKATEIAVTRAPMEGENAVTRDEAGNLSVRLLPNVTEYGRAFNRAASASYLAQLSGDIRDSAVRLTHEANGNAEAFSASWTAFSDRIIEQAAPELRGGVRQLLDEVGGSTNRGIVGQAFERTQARALNALTTEQSRLLDEVLTLAAQGGVDTPEFEAAFANFVDIGQEILRSPNYAGSPEAQALLRDRTMAQAVIEATAAEVVARYPFDPAGGLEHARSRIYDTALALSPQERDQALAAIERRYTAEGSAYQVALDGLGDRVDDAVEILRNNPGWADPSLIAELVGEARRLNDVGSLLRLETAVAQHDLLRLVPDTDLEAAIAGANALRGAVTGPAVASPEDIALIQSRVIGGGVEIQGITGDVSWRLAAMIRAAEAEGVTLTITSGYRSEAEQAQLYANYTQEPVYWEGEVYTPQVGPGVQGLAAPPGASRHGHGTAIDLAAGPGLEWAHANAGRFGFEFLSGDAFTADPGHMQLAGAADGAAGAARLPPEIATPSFVGDVQARVSTALRNAIEQQNALLDANGIVSDVAAASLVEAALLSNDATLQQNVAEIIATSAGAIAANGGSTDRSQQLLAILAGNMGSDGTAALGAWYQQGFEDRATYLRGLRETDPLREGVARGWYPEVQVDFTSPQSINQGLRALEANARLYRERTGMGAVPLLSAEQAAVVANAWQSAPVPQRLELLRTFSTSIQDGEILAATLSQIAGQGGEVVAFAADVAVGDQATARGIIVGQELAAREPTRLPSEAEWAARAFDILPPSLFSGIAELDPQRQLVLDAARFLYVSLGYEAGVAPGAQFDAARARTAIERAVGGLVTFNGRQIIAPVRGMGQQQFDALFSGRGLPIAATPFGLYQGPLVGGERGGAFSRDIVNSLRFAETARGLPIAPESIIGRSDVRLRTVGDGRYFVQFGPDAAPEFARDSRTGEIFIWNLGAAAVAPYARSYLARFGYNPDGPARNTSAAPAGSPALPPAAAPGGMTADQFDRRFNPPAPGG